ncbi:P-loop containing nucleoside triphosphate hydrolase protein, partial [Cryphonectria parasitica EP155]
GTIPTANGIPLISPAQVIPDRFRTAFPYNIFNSVQSKCFHAMYETDDNVVVSAPTGSGKTALLELAICKLANQRSNDQAKIVYLSPTKALCKEKAVQWQQRFGPLSMPVSELTGDTSRSDMRRVREARIIVTTPEKWDSITRSWTDHRKLLDLVKLFLIDEVHILGESRGATLEAIVSRMKTYGAKIRFIALSATIPNSEDIATWLGRNHAHPSMPSYREVFGEEFRPVKLEKKVHGFNVKMSDYAFDSYLNSQLWEYIKMYSQRKPMLVFCMTRKSCHDAAKQLAEKWSQQAPSARLWPEPRKAIPVIDASLQEMVRSGVAFHHAGLDAGDKKAVHEAFMEGSISVICCTSTLAVGVNLPCHTVLLKGTVCYQEGQLHEYSDLEIMQMLGRAGRPQFEDTALAIILTRSRNKKRYENLGSGQQIVESTFHKNMIEHLNSEISLETFRDINGAKDWLKGTFLSVRLLRNPSHYRDLTAGSHARTAEGRLQQICESTISSLWDAQLITGSSTYFCPTEYGQVMSKYMIRFSTMKQILNIPRGANTQTLLNALCDADEFREIRWQTDEKKTFREINSDPFIKYPVGNNVSTLAHKVSLLLQIEVGHVELKEFERRRLRGEASRVLEVMHRLVRAVVECKQADSDGKACRAALELARSMTAKAWEGTVQQLLQVPQLGPALLRKLVSNNIRTVASLANADTSTIERIASRNPPFGKKMADTLRSFPRLAIKAKIKDSSMDAKGRPVVHVDVILAFTSTRGYWQGRMPLVNLLAVTSEGILAHFWRDSLGSFRTENGNSCQVCFTWSPTTLQETLSCQFACEEIVGTVVSAEVSHDIPAAKFP